MSLIRQIWLLLLLTLVLAFGGGFGLSLISARTSLSMQIGLQNQNSALSLAQILGQDGRLTVMAATLDRQFQLGGYARLRLLDAQGLPVLERTAAPVADGVPAWFARWVDLDPLPGRAEVMAGPQRAGMLEVQSSTRFALQEFWAVSQRSLAAMVALGALMGVVGWTVLRRLRQPLARTVEQARALTERRFVTVSEPDVPELRQLTRAMNAMVERLKALFDEQAGQVEHWRRQAHADPMTGVSNRAHFMTRLKLMLQSEEHAAGGALLLVRVGDLQGLNRRLGRQRTDDLLREAAHTILDSVGGASVFEVGRLNGSDFAIVLPEVDSLREPAMDVATRLRSLWRGQLPPVSAVIGAVRWWHGAPLSALLAAADHALARAEARGPFAVELDDSGGALALGEDAWRQVLRDALSAGQAALAEFPLIDMNAAVVHLECPLRLPLQGATTPAPAAEWLPMAKRTQLTAQVDLVAVELALKAIARDNMSRAVNLSPRSLQDSQLIPRLRALLDTHAASAPGLWLEVDEQGALNQLPLLRELVGMAHARSARVGLEHAGHHLSDPSALLEAGLDFVKLDASVTEGMAHDEALGQHADALVRMLHGIGLKVYAEGVANADDAAALWRAGVDGITGPAARR